MKNIEKKQYVKKLLWNEWNKAILSELWEFIC